MEEGRVWHAFLEKLRCRYCKDRFEEHVRSADGMKCLYESTTYQATYEEDDYPPGDEIRDIIRTVLRETGR